ncbi:fluoride efflux transporter FluC [Nocardioides sp.]|uniref:fluoride efflux transporter FluC n=1 Tax=Nocardioides sp. TaxID=35761 RepID=UPI002C4E8E15|nr:CrcB family protein [Nocardioides sp.]HXH77347.1 CrcB family protein [Nocardioides sp.]
MTALLVALGAAVGGPLRYLCAETLDGRWPLGTLVVNAVGSGLAGVFAALSLGGHTWAFAFTGFCGALTSYSAFAVQAVDRGPRLGLAYAAITTGATLALCVGGFALAHELARQA